MGSETVGKTSWIFPDGEMPPAGQHEIKGHESVIILNTTGQTAHVDMTLYFADRPPVAGIGIAVEAQRVRCIRMDDPAQLGGYGIEREQQYAIQLTSDIPVIAQYGRLDTRDQPMAFYATPGYCQ